MNLAQYVETLNLLGDESRLRLCALLRERELCVTDLVRVTGHRAVARLDAPRAPARGGVRARSARKGAQSFYALATDSLPEPGAGRPRRGGELRRSRRWRATSSAWRSSTPSGAAGCPSRSSDEIERDYSPGRTWQSLAVGLAALLAARRRARRRARATARPRARSRPIAARSPASTRTPRMIEAARERLGAATRTSRAQVADVHELPFRAASFDAVLCSTRSPTPSTRRARSRSARACCARAGGSCCSASTSTSSARSPRRYGERHPGFSPRAAARACSRAPGSTVVVRRGRLPRGQEAPFPGRAGHRRQAEPAPPRTQGG